MFKTAKPIWIKNYRQMCNVQCGFRNDFTADTERKYILKITGASVFRVYLNGKFVHYGPARAAHGYLRYDEVVIDAKPGINKLAIEVAGYNCNGFYTLRHESFVIAELYDEEGNIISATGRDFKGLLLDKLRKRIVFRYSYQRDFSEVWKLDNNAELTNWRTSDKLLYDKSVVVPVSEEYIQRGVPLPKYDVISASYKGDTGVFEHIGGVCKYEDELQNVRVSCEFQGYHTAVIEDRPAEELNGNYIYKRRNVPIASLEIKKNEYVTAQFPFNDTGFLRTKVKVKKDCVMYVIFSEALENDMIAFAAKVVNGVNVIKYTLKASDKEYELESFEPYTCKHIGVVVKEGEIEIGGFSLREYCYPYADAVKFVSDNKELSAVFEAARETFRQNTLDVYMDCPSRERGPWLCDSYFMGYAEQLLTMDTKVEKIFFDNFNMAKEFPCIPDGMIPMCYPSDHYGGVYIPQYALWFILQFGEFAKRSGMKNAEKYKAILYGIIDFFKERLNDEGLLEELEGWNFIEWSDANKYMSGIHIPTNMLYSKACTIVADLFEDDELKLFAEDLKQSILEVAYDGTFFRDNAERNEDGVLNFTENKSEICQYIAFFTGIADNSKKFQGLKKELITKCGANLKNENLAKANAFVGNYLRMYLYRVNNAPFDKNAIKLAEIPIFERCLKYGTSPDYVRKNKATTPEMIIDVKLYA